MSWEYSFVLGGVPGLVCAPFLLRYRDSHRSEISRVGLVEGVRGLWRVALLRYIKLGYVLNTAALGGIAVFVPSYGEQVVGMGLREVNQYFGIILLLAGFAGTFFGGRLASHVARSAEDKSAMLCRYSGVVSLLAVIPVFMAFSTESAWLFLSACFIAELLVFASVAPVLSLIHI